MSQKVREIYFVSIQSQEKHSSFDQTCAKIPKRSGIQGPQDPRSGIFIDLGSYILILSRDPTDPGSCPQSLSLDPMDLGSRAYKLSMDPADPGSYEIILSPDLEDPGSVHEFIYRYILVLVSFLSNQGCIILM